MRLLERAKALGDYLIVGVTSDDFDRQRGKINVQQPLEERVAAVRATGLADKIIVEEYEGQKIDDIKRYGVDVFTVGSDWAGHFDYLGEYCRVTYLERTQGVSSTEIRSSKRLRCGLVGYTDYIDRVYAECALVNGLEVAAVCAEDRSMLGEGPLGAPLVTADYGEMLGAVDAVYVYSHPDRHFEQVRRALGAGKHVMCEAPMAKSAEECDELFALADERGLVLMDSLRTAYSTAYARMLLLIAGGRIGDVVSVDATCTSMRTNKPPFAGRRDMAWSSMGAWAPTALLPVFQILGTKPDRVRISSLCDEGDRTFDEFSRIAVEYPGAVATAKAGAGAKSEGSLVISGTKGYVYVPAPLVEDRLLRDPLRGPRRQQALLLPAGRRGHPLRVGVVPEDDSRRGRWARRRGGAAPRGRHRPRRDARDLRGDRRFRARRGCEVLEDGCDPWLKIDAFIYIAVVPSRVPG